MNAAERRNKKRQKYKRIENRNKLYRENKGNTKICVNHPRESMSFFVFFVFLSSLPFLAFLLGHVVTTTGRSDVSAQL